MCSKTSLAFPFPMCCSLQVVVKKARVKSAAIPENLIALVDSHSSSGNTSEVRVN